MEDLMNTIKQCKAKSKRSKKRCKNLAIKGMDVCYHHGGCLGAKKAKKTRIQAPFKHGFYSKENILERKMFSKLLKNSKENLS
jgi:hypothetical protein